MNPFTLSSIINNVGSTNVQVGNYIVTNTSGNVILLSNLDSVNEIKIGNFLNPGDDEQLFPSDPTDPNENTGGNGGTGNGIPDPIQNNNYGTLSPSYTISNNIYLTTRDFIRYPRENYETDNASKIKYTWKWIEENDTIFYYDLSSIDKLEELPYVYLNKTNESSNVLLEQNVFDSVSYDLDFIDSTTNTNFLPSPMLVHIGYSDSNENVQSKFAVLEKSEDTSLTFTNPDLVVINHIIPYDRREIPYIKITIDNSTNIFFTNSGFKIGEIIEINVTDISNSKGQYISKNNGLKGKIRSIYDKILILDYIDTSIASDEPNIIFDYPVQFKNTNLKINLKIADRIVAKFLVEGQTEEEDERYKILLQNEGKLIVPEDSYIFKEYSVKEQGIDWIFLNKKRKELILNKSEIYPYIGAYKSLINSINYFGYNDLEVYEYYRNINEKSKLFNTLFKVEIPDLFDNTIEGYNQKDFISDTLPNENYESTNLFNLTYRITDFDGNNVLDYNLDDTTIKYQGLKNWLEKNIVPITHNILDITGRTDNSSDIVITHENYYLNSLEFKQNMSPVSFNINEAYTLPISSGSTKYNVQIEFDVNNFLKPDYYNIEINTYQTYPEWNPIYNYSRDSLVEYFGKFYQSEIGQNKFNSPNRYDSVSNFDSEAVYNYGDLVRFEKRIFRYVNSTTWDLVSTWIEVSLKSIQSIREYRDISNLNNYNLTVDSSIDPFVEIRVTSDNGYGQIFTDHKNYTLNSTLNITSEMFSLYDLPILNYPV